MLTRQILTLRALGPPQNSELLPEQGMLQRLKSMGAPPLSNSRPQTSKRKLAHIRTSNMNEAYSIDQQTLDQK